MIFWRDDGLWARLWRLFWWFPSVLFGTGVKLRAWAYRRGYFETVRVPLPVFCVGNLTVGGSGKTPGVLWLASELKRRGRRPVVISRGYGRRSKEVLAVPSPSSGDMEALPPLGKIGDEPRLFLRRGIPVVVGSDRSAAAERAWETFRPDCLLMDDGFQHFRLFRDRNFICLDARLGHRVYVEGQPAPLLPAGPWREPPENIARASVVFLTRSMRLHEAEMLVLKEALQRLGVSSVPVRERLSFMDLAHQREVSAEVIKGAPVLALSGLGDPTFFEKSLESLGAQVAAERFPDHHVFTDKDLARTQDRANREGRRVVVTEKDRERLPDGFPVLVARLDWEVEESPLWTSVIESVIS